MTSGIAAAAWCASCGVVVLPIETRIDAPPSTIRPMAVNTWLGLAAPL